MLSFVPTLLSPNRTSTRPWRSGREVRHPHPIQRNQMEVPEGSPTEGTQEPIAEIPAWTFHNWLNDEVIVSTTVCGIIKP